MPSTHKKFGMQKIMSLTLKKIRAHKKKGKQIISVLGLQSFHPKKGNNYGY